MSKIFSLVPDSNRMGKSYTLFISKDILNEIKDVISRDKHLLDLIEYGKIKIIKPKAALDLLK